MPKADGGQGEQSAFHPSSYRGKRFVKHLASILVFVCFGSLFLLCYGPALFQARQFGFRDAAHFYYPLYERVQAEWNQGRWPLWEPEENAGMPLLGNPAAAVLYPGKLVFAVMPYPWGARIYIVMHTALAFVAMLVLLRSWGISSSGMGLGALSFTFGAPILFQSSNVIYLVGAAWLPLGMHAVDRWVRLGRRWGLWELALVLAMQVLGGDPQAAYLLGLAGAGYALGLAWSRARARTAQHVEAEDGPSGTRPRSVVPVFGLIAAVLVWSAATVAMGVLLPKLREPHFGPATPPLRWMPWMPMAVAVAWGVAGVGFLYFYCWHRRRRLLPLGTMWLGLVLAAAVAAAMTAAQLLPVIEFTQLTTRAAAGGLHAIYSFSVEPYRLPELIWPNFEGFQSGENSYWPDVIRIPGVYPKIWVPSLYLGVMTVILAAGALASRQGPPWRVWLSAIALISSLGGLGQYTSPIGAARTALAMAHSPSLERLAKELGPVDTPGDSPIRHDGFLKDGDGSIYWWLASLLPGFRQFRYPGKLFTFTSLALAALAGAGWDRFCTGRARRGIVAIGFLIVVSLGVLAVVVIERHPILAAFGSHARTSESGPLDSAKGYEAIVRSLVHCLLVLGLGLVLIMLAPTRPQVAGPAALIVMTLDLAVANSRHVMTVGQSMFEGRPALVQIIAKAEAALEPPRPGPFRVHRMLSWSPLVWNHTTSADRVGELVAWERDTIRSKYGISFGIEYTHTRGVAELSDYEWYFSGSYRMVIGPVIANRLGTDVGKRVIYFPRRAYDMWNTRYFVVPAYANGWRDEMRASAAFRFESELIYPEKGRFDGPRGKDDARTWMETQDFEVLRNLQEFPRSWVVHSARAIPPVDGHSPEPAAKGRQEVLYARDLFWNDPTLPLYDPHAVAWVSRTDLSQIMPRLSGQPPAPSESVTVRYPNPQRAILDVTLESPGLVILSDVDYPGWRLTIDDEPAPIYRVNVSMRGALVSAGSHRLVYSFAPRSFYVGLIGSTLGLGAWLVLGLLCVFRPTHPVLAADCPPPSTNL
jgi:hypothetical protein